MELSKKTTMLFSPELHHRLAGLAAHRGVSLGGLVREACEARYGFVDSDARMDAVHALASLALPVASVKRMKQESQPTADKSHP